MRCVESGSLEQPVREDINHAAASSSESARKSQQNCHII